MGFCDPEFRCALTCPRHGRGDGGDGHGGTEAAGAHGHAAELGGLTGCEGDGGTDHGTMLALKIVRQAAGRGALGSGRAA